jgi:hypothetical protein
MKKNRNSTKLNFGKGLNAIPTFLLWNLFYTTKGHFSCDIFQYFKTENEKLQIVYANIRV